MRLIQATTVALAAAITALAACASSGPKAPCAIAKLDSVYVGLAPVYEDCAVDRQAKLIAVRDEALQYRPTRPVGGTGCIFADVQFVVDTLGIPEPGTARIVKTND